MGGIQSGTVQQLSFSSPDSNSDSYRPRNPEDSLLFQIVRDHWKAFEQMTEQEGNGLPKFVRDEFESFFRCGVLQHGFVRLKCDSCSHEKIVGFSCKKRGFCSSCISRNQAETAANLNDLVLPEIPYRQWVMSFPISLRFLMARRPEVLSQILKIHISEISRFIRRKTRVEVKKFEIPLERFQTSAYTAIQRFGSALSLNIHYHSLFFDGGYLLPESENGVPEFFAIKAPSNNDMAAILIKIVGKIRIYLAKAGYLTAEGDLISNTESDLGSEEVLSQLQMASVQNRVGTGENIGKRVRLIKNELFLKDVKFESLRCVQISGFSLHANVEVEDKSRDQLETVIRYFTRSPVVEKRLHKVNENELFYEFKSPWKDGTIGVKFTPFEFLEKLAALVPLPRRHLFSYHGLLAPNSKYRDKIVRVSSEPSAQENISGEKVEAPPPKRPRRICWSDLLKRVFHLDLVKCPDCNGTVRFISAVMKKDVIGKILEHLKVPIEPPRFATARSTL